MTAKKQLRLAAIALALVSGTEAYAYDFEQDGLYFDVISLPNKTCMLTSGEVNYSGDVVIPQTVKYKGILEFTVDSIKDDLFRGNEAMTSLTISPDIRFHIGDYAFRYCTNLSKIVLPQTVKGFGKNAFDGCSNLVDIVIPQSVTGIGQYAFYGCSSLKEIELPDSLVTISDHIFMNCTSLNHVGVPNIVEKIGTGAFYNCVSLASIRIPNSLETIGKSAFYNCNGMKQADYSNIESLCYMNYEDEYANPLYYAQHIYINDEEVQRIDIPEGVTEIGKYAFINSSISFVSIPATVARIGLSAFQGCQNMHAAYFPAGVQEIEASAFFNCNSLTRITISGDMNTIGDNAFANCKSLKTLILRDGAELLSLGSNTINGNESLFSSCKLDSLYLGRNLKYADVPFRDQTNLKSIVLGENVSELGDYAFRYCSSLTDVYVKMQSPILLPANTFFSKTFTTATIHISLGTEENYLFAEQWKDFTRFDVIDDWPEEFIQEEPEPEFAPKRARVSIRERVRSK